MWLGSDDKSAMNARSVYRITRLTLVQITTILFDCDNTLVLSEELAFEACAELANEILESKNIPDRCLFAHFPPMVTKGVSDNSNRHWSPTSQ